MLDYNTDFKCAGQIAASTRPTSSGSPITTRCSSALNLKTTAAGVCALTQKYVTNAGLQNSLCVKLRQGSYGAFANEVEAQTRQGPDAAAGGDPAQPLERCWPNQTGPRPS